MVQIKHFTIVPFMHIFLGYRFPDNTQMQIKQDMTQRRVRVVNELRLYVHKYVTLRYCETLRLICHWLSFVGMDTCKYLSVCLGLVIMLIFCFTFIQLSFNQCQKGLQNICDDALLNLTYSEIGLHRCES